MQLLPLSLFYSGKNGRDDGRKKGEKENRVPFCSILYLWMNEGDIMDSN
jgi:hypothetical protein